MNRLALLCWLTLSAAGVAPAADGAASFFDDSAVPEIRMYFDDSNWYNTLFQAHNSNPEDPYFPVRFQYGDITLPKVGVRFKGNSSFRRNGVKKSFKLDFNEYDDNVTFLGLKKLNLNNGDLQPDFLHEKLFLDFAGKYIAAMRAVHVRVYVNDVYYGLYIAIEQPDKTMMESRFGAGEDGNLFEAGESAAATMAYLGANPSSYTRAYELKTNEEGNDYSGLISLLDILNNTPAAELPSKLEPLMDVENVLYGMALNALFTNLESYLGTASEYFLYDRSSDGRFMHIHWDLNETFGSTGDGTPRLANPFTMDPFYLPAAGGQGGGGGAANNARPLLQRLWAVDAYKQLYLQMLARMLREGFDEQSVGARVQELASRIRTDYTADPNKAYTMAQFESALTGQVTANGFTTYGLTQFVRERTNYLRPLLHAAARASDVRLNEIAIGSRWVELYNLGPGPVSTSGFFLSDDEANPTKWSVPARTLADGEFLIVSLEGANPAAAGTLSLYAAGARIDSFAYAGLATGQTYARTGLFGSTWKTTTTATQGTANTITAPTSGGATAGTGQLLINEVMADNDNFFPDPDEPGAYDDWFEVYNPGTSTVDMSGMYITDNLNNPTKWKVPDGVTIPAGGRLVFLADSSTNQGPLHTSWSLSVDGESIGIYATDGKTLIDSVSFGPQQTDVAYGRTSDGSADWSLFVPATPGAANANAIANWILNGASFQIGPLAPDSIASAFTQGLATSGISVTVTDSAGTARPADVYFSAVGQVNFRVPTGSAAGRGRVSIRKSDGSNVTGDALIDPVAPGLFSANADGTGVSLALALRADAQGNQTRLEPFRFDATQQKYVAAPLSLGSESDQLYVVLYGTGWRGVKALTSVTAQIGGVNVPVTYAGAQGQFPGLDQVNIGPLPRTLQGKGEASVVLDVDGRPANSLIIQIQ